MKAERAMGECGRGEDRMKGELQRGQEESRASRTNGMVARPRGEGEGGSEGRDEAAEGVRGKEVGTAGADGVEERREQGHQRCEGGEEGVADGIAGRAEVGGQGGNG